MAEPIPGFSPEESDVLRQAFETGRLTDEEKQWIIDQVNKAGSAVEGDVTAIGEPQKPFGQRALESLSTRETASALGGTAGTILGTATMPATGLAGPVVGGGLGAAAGAPFFYHFQKL